MFVLPVIAHLLDGERMGAWALLGATSFLIGYADLGLATAVQRSAVTEEHERTRRLIGLSLLVQAVLLPFFLAGAYVYLVQIPGAPDDVQREATWAALPVLLSGALLGLGQPYRMFVLARGGVRQVANVRTFAAVCQVLVLIGGFWRFGATLYVPAFALLTSNGLDCLLTARAARQIDRQIPLGPRRPIEKRETFSAFHDGAAAFSLNLAVSAALRVDLFVLSAVAPLALVGTYQVAGRAVDMAYLIAKQSTVAIMPELGKAEHRARAVRIGTGVFSGVVIAGMAAVAIVGQPFLVAVFDEHAAGQAAAVVLVLLSTAAMVMSLYEMASSMVMLGGRTAWDCAVPIVIGSLVNLVISVSLAPHFQVWAVAGSTVAGNVLTFVLMWRRAKRILDWSFGRVVEVLAPGLSAAAVSVGVALALRPLVDHPAWSLGACMLTTALGVAAAALVMRWRGRAADRNGGAT
jgi:O-antigen/teichoic acid export membrane protein